MLRFLKLLIPLIFLAGSPHAQETMVFTLPDNAKVEASYYILKEAYGQMGYNIRIERYPPTRALYMSNEGHVDGEMHRIDGMSNSYPNLIQVPVVVGKLIGEVYTIHEDFVVDGFESLRPYRIGVRRGIVFSERGTKGMDVLRADTIEQLLRSLMARHTDVVVLNRLDGQTLIESFAGSGIRSLKPPVVEVDFYHYVNATHAHLVPELTRILKDMESSGRIEELMLIHARPQ